MPTAARPEWTSRCKYACPLSSETNPGSSPVRLGVPGDPWPPLAQGLRQPETFVDGFEGGVMLSWVSWASCWTGTAYCAFVTRTYSGVRSHGGRGRTILLTVFFLHWDFFEPFLVLTCAAVHYPGTARAGGERQVRRPSDSNRRAHRHFDCLSCLRRLHPTCSPCAHGCTFAPSREVAIHRRSEEAFR